MVSLPDFRDVRRAPSRMIHEGDHETIEVKMAHWGAPFYVFTDPDDQHRSIVHESELDRPEKVRTVPHTRNPSFFAACVANLPTQHPHPTSRRLLVPLEPKSGERLARVCAVERRVRASDLPTSRGASGRRTGGRASVRRGTSILGWEPWGSETHAHRDKKHVDTIDDDHAYPMLRRCIFALSRATRADIIRSALCTGGEILLSVMGS